MPAKDARLSVRIDRDEYAALRRVAAADDRTPAAVVRRLVRRHLAACETSSARTMAGAVAHRRDRPDQQGDAGAS